MDDAVVPLFGAGQGAVDGGHAGHPHVVLGVTADLFPHLFGRLQAVARKVHPPLDDHPLSGQLPLQIVIGKGVHDGVVLPHHPDPVGALGLVRGDLFHALQTAGEGGRDLFPVGGGPQLPEKVGPGGLEGPRFPLEADVLADEVVHRVHAVHHFGGGQTRHGEPGQGVMRVDLFQKGEQGQGLGIVRPRQIDKFEGIAEVP